MERLLQVRKLDVGYPGSGAVVSQITLTVCVGEVVALIGKSSAGKTTLLRTLAGLIDPLGGKVLVLGKEPRALHGTGALQYLHQEAVMWEHLTPEGVLLLTQKLLGFRPERERAWKLMEDCGLTSEADKYGYELSPGAKSRLSLARAFCSEPSLVLLDEPFSSVDYINRDVISQMLIKFANSYRTSLVWVTHDISEAIRFAHRIVMIRQGGAGYKEFECPASLRAPDPNHFQPEMLKLRDDIVASL